MTEFFVSNGNLRLHGLANGSSDSQPPVVFIPGLWGEAEQFAPILEMFSPRRAFAVSLRGRGRSDVPDAGYSLDDHVSDVRAFIEHLNLESFYLVSVSAGASYAIAYAAEAGPALKGLVLVDYPAVTKAYPLEMIKGVLADVKVPVISEKFLVGLQRESQARQLDAELRKISCPVTVFGGGLPGAYLNEDHLGVYRENTRQISVRILQQVAHDPLENPQCFFQELGSVI